MHIDLVPNHHFVVNPAGSSSAPGATLHEGLRRDMPWQRPLPQRLRTALNLGVLICFLAAGLLISWIRATSVAQQAVDQVHADARALAMGMAAALAQNDRLDVRALLEAMTHKGDLLAVAVHDAQGRRLATYAKSRDSLAGLPGPLTRTADAGGFLAERFPARIVLWEPIGTPNSVLGTLVLEADLDPRWRSFFGEITWICAALLFSLLLCAALVNLVQNNMVDPIYRLERTCKVIVEDRDYTLRAWKAARDEIGGVVDCINHLLDEVHRRGSLLVATRTELAQALAAGERAIQQSANVPDDSARLRAHFLVNMCHEIRTPLNRAGTLCHDLEATSLSAAQRDLVASVHATSDLVIALLDDLLDYARLENGKLEMQEADFNPLEVMETVTRIYAERARAKNLRMTVMLGEGVPGRVRGDRARLRQVVGTLLGSSIKYAQGGEIRVVLSATPGEDQHVALQIDVLDSGFGIAEEARLRIHQSLTQIQDAVLMPSGSASLGISIANHLIQRMGGQLRLRESDEGSTGFSFTVSVEATEPAREPATAQSAQTRPVPPSPSLQSARTGKTRKAAAVRTGETRRRAERSRPRGADLTRQVAEVYLDSAPELVLLLRQAIDHGVVEEIEDAAHTLGTCSARVGANQVAELCRRIEGCAQQGEVSELPTRMSELLEAFERARSSLTHEVLAASDTLGRQSASLSTTLQ